MFAILAGAKPGEVLKPVTTRALINASIITLGGELRDLQKVWPLLDGVQRARVKLALCEAIGALNSYEQAPHPGALAGVDSYDVLGGLAAEHSGWIKLEVSSGATDFAVGEAPR